MLFRPIGQIEQFPALPDLLLWLGAIGITLFAAYCIDRGYRDLDAKFEKQRKELEQHYRVLLKWYQEIERWHKR